MSDVFILETMGAYDLYTYCKSRGNYDSRVVSIYIYIIRFFKNDIYIYNYDEGEPWYSDKVVP